MNEHTVKLKVDLLMTKVSILKLKADHYAWQCHTDAHTKNQLEESLKEIDELTKALNTSEQS